MSEQLSLDTRHRDGGNYIADDEVHPTTVWFANGRKVSIEHTEVKSEILYGLAYLQIDRELHPAFAAMKPAATNDNKTTQSGPVLSDVEIAGSVSDAELELLTYLRPNRTITISDPIAAYLFCGETGLTQEQTIRVAERLRKWGRGEQITAELARLRSELSRADKESDDLDTALRKLCEPVLGYDGAWGKSGVNADPIPGIEGVVAATIAELEAQVKELKQRHSGGNY